MTISNIRASLLRLAAAFIVSNTNASPVNLVSNGSFEAGNSNFTSDYSYSPGVNSTEGEYTVRTNPFPWNGFFISTGDHTSGTGLMMVANGSPVSGSVVWQSEPIAVTNGPNYFFEAFVNNVCCTSAYTGPNSPSILEFSLSVNGGAAVSLGTITTNLGLAGTWEGLSTQFASAAAGNAVLSLINRNTSPGGNDFAVDDIYFGTESTVIPPLPEPVTLSLLGLGLAGLGFSRSRKKL
ncbi:PEP-CTERM sorting domain-containing protein [Accumulibacter sp.]|uniref:PEP-CTERM sorting domain-containing protein n=1 Tax=Accumulibacter sp. TaxID=2053492 RepID=UPI002628703F|nr:PEP-CTERM sorting domain-containing protein [Accumulibacter sp.]